MRTNLARTLTQLEHDKAFIHRSGDKVFITASGQKLVEKKRLTDPE